MQCAHCSHAANQLRHVDACTGVDKGAQGAQPPLMAGQKRIFLLKWRDFQRLSLAPCLPPVKSGRACYDNPTGRGYFYQMSNMYTFIAYLIEIRKFCSKNLVHKGVNFEAQNALKHLRAPLISKKFRELYPRTPVKKGRGEGKGRTGRGNSHSWLRHWTRVTNNASCNWVNLK